VPWQTTVTVQLQAGNTIINPNGTFVYSGNPGTGNLIASVTPAAGTDNFGNHYLEGVASYAATTATASLLGSVGFYAGSLAAGWGGALSAVAGDGAGNLQVNAGGQLQLLGGGGVTIQGSGSTGGPDSTGFFNTQGLASGSYGSTHQHTLPNFPTATHDHPL
jgi:hypothetical protein